MAALRCERCGHHYDHHSADGCRVHKIRQDNQSRLWVDVSACICKWYLGDVPPLDNVDDCPHEFQVDVAPDVCVRCRRKIQLQQPTPARRAAAKKK